jgi:molybdopterin-dependent oxidoreductase alpha subunit
VSDRLPIAPAPGAAPPDDGTVPTVRRPSSSAGGWGALRSTVAHAAQESGVVHGARALLRANQASGFDCPGCAWPEPSHRSRFEFCENGAKAIVSEATRARADRSFFASHDIGALRAMSDRALQRAGRLTEPMVRRRGARFFTPLDWEDALELTGGVLRSLPDPNRAAFYTSGRTSNEAAFLYQLYVRCFGTNNLPDCSNLCHESSGVGLTEAIGVGKGTVTLEDFDHAELILVIGQNPGTNHPRMLSTLQQAVRRGAKVVSINPLREAGTEGFRHPQEVRGMLGLATALSSMHVPVRINGDVALLQGVMKAMLELDAAAGRTRIAWSFVRARTRGADALVAQLEALSWDALCVSSGIDEPSIRALAEICLASRATIACWAMGLTQHENGVANVQSVVNLLLLGGHFGRPGAGACPVRGHSNVQGDRTMGIWEQPPKSFVDALEARFQHPMPHEHGLDVVGTIAAMERGEVEALVAMGGNFLQASPDTHRTARALAACRLVATVSTKLNRGHLVDAATNVILPCLARSEVDVQASGPQFVTVENSMGVVHASRGTFPPAAPTLRSEVAIVCGLARTTLGSVAVDWDAMEADYRVIRRAIADVVPGFEHMERRVARDGGFALPNAVREGRFATSDGRALFTAHPLPPDPRAPDELWMMTIRSHDQYNTTVYDEDDRYRGIYGGRRVVFANADDLAERGLSAGERVDLSSTYDGAVRTVEGFVVVPYEIPRACVATYFPEANPLVPLEVFASRSRTPASKSVRIRLHRRHTE